MTHAAEGTRWFTFEPLDSLFFRDGRPFNQDDPNQADTTSLFPPYPPTMVGALRAALARALGWNGRREGKAWPEEVLGTGTDWQDEENTSLGPLEFAGPFLMKDDELLFPAPLHLLRRDKQKGEEGSRAPEPGTDGRCRKCRSVPREYALLEPGGQMECDLGEVRLPVAPEGGRWKPAEGCWVTRAGMERILAGECPDPKVVFCPDCLWRTEPRIGIARELESRTVKRQENGGGLFATRHVRLAPGVKLVMAVRGVPNELSLDGVITPLGGEGRAAAVSELEKPPALPEENKAAEGEKAAYIAVFITPADLAERPKPGEAVDGLPGRVVSAAIGKPVRIGGWDGVARRPIPLRACLPAGSVLFLEECDGRISACSIGRAREWGFGRVLIGRWPVPSQDGKGGGP
ncbi:MAG: CRISPR-associated protein Cmr3 [Rhodothalassiaceae bacterium]|nr:MAG: CRISPR-associated protein Cmr3 [Rhodothalassiaceae bacterium]